MARPSFRDHPPALEGFRQALAATGSLESAVRRAMARGGYVSPEELADYMPVTRELERLERVGETDLAIDLRNREHDRLLDEKNALAASRALRTWAETTSLADDEARAAAEREKSRLEQRAAFAEARACELRAQWQAAQMAGFREQAAAEFDRAHPPVTTSPPTRRAPRASSKGAAT